jgi:hypothetical protein
MYKRLKTYAYTAQMLRRLAIAIERLGTAQALLLAAAILCTVQCAHIGNAGALLSAATAMELSPVDRVRQLLSPQAAAAV